MSKAEFDASRFGQVWNKIGLNIDPVNAGLHAGSVAYHAVQSAIDSVIDRIETLRDLTRRADLLGVPERSLIGLSEVAGKLSGVDLPAFESAFTKMTSNIASAAMGEGEAGGALERLGLDPTELSSLRADEQFLKIADALQQVQNAGERLALSKTILGKGGVELASTLAAGGDAIRELMAEEIAASQIDIVNLDNIKTASDALDDLGDSINGLGNLFANTLAPSIATTAKGMEILVSEFLKIDSDFMDTLRGPKPAEKSPDEVYQEAVEASREKMKRKQEAQAKAEEVAANARYKADSKRQEELADQEEKARIADEKAANKRYEDDSRRQEELADLEEKTMREGQRIKDSLASPAEKLKKEFEDVESSFASGGIDAATRSRAIQDLQMRARDMVGGDAQARTVGVVRGGSVEALRQQFGGTSSEKQLAEQKKTAENTATANTLLDEIKTAILSNQLKEAV
jgi:hypothetical protein